MKAEAFLKRARIFLAFLTMLSLSSKVLADNDDLIKFLLSSPIFADSDFPLAQIPDGYEDGLKDAPYGVYSSAFAPAVRPLQNRLLQLENKVFGLALISDQDVAKVAELSILLEAYVIRLHQEISNLPKDTDSAFSKDALLYSCARLYSTLRHHSERIFEDMVRYIDVEMPGPNGRQLMLQIDPQQVEYDPNFRSDEPLNTADAARLYDARLKEFLDRGGKLSEIQTLDQAMLEKMGGYTRVEYVALASSTSVPLIKVTTGKAGHLLLASGKSVLAAGQMIFVKNSFGEFTLLIVSNSSGNYKPDIFSASNISESVRNLIGLDHRLVIVTKGEPVSSQALKVYLKGRGMPMEQITEIVRIFENRINAIIYPAKTVSGGESCQSLFAAD